MFNTPSKLAFWLFALVTAPVASLVAAPSSWAFSFFGDDSIGIDANDVGQSFAVNFDGNVDTQNVDGLSSEAIFTFKGFKTIGEITEASFDISLENTSTGSITSRTSALGFKVLNLVDTPQGHKSLGTQLSLLGVGDDSATSGGSSKKQNNVVTLDGKTRSSGLFVNDRSGKFPNQFGDVDVCFTNGNTCEGGQGAGNGGGVSTNAKAETFSATLAMTGNLSQFALQNFGVRYQSIEGTPLGTSGTGTGTIKKTSISPKNPKEIPEPATTSAILLTGALMLKLTSKRKQSEASGSDQNAEF